jgi:redox-sensing transcriptional repressor
MADNESRRKRIPPSVVKRLTRYFTHVEDLIALGTEWVASRELAEALGLTSSTVRQDLSHLNFYGISKRGYRTRGFLTVLAKLLGTDTEWKMVVVGAGNLGRALALHEEFSRRGFRICGIFDKDPRKAGRKVGSLTVQPIRRMPLFIKDNQVDVGIIAVPASAAQSVADLLILSRIRSILNMTLTHLVAPRQVAVVDSRIVGSLLELSHAMTNASPPGSGRRHRR